MIGSVVRISNAAFGGPGTGVLVGGYLFVRRDKEILLWQQRDILPGGLEILPIKVNIEASDLVLADRKLAADAAFGTLCVLEAFDVADEADNPTPPEAEEPPTVVFEVIPDESVSAEAPPIDQGPHALVM
jgi:hypothetical protein